MTDSKLSKRLKAGIVILIALTVCLCITTSALVYSTLTVENNLFQTGKVSIDLNGGAPIIGENEFRLSPGLTVEKEFYLQNNSTDGVYYRLYFENVSGDLSGIILIQILHDDLLLYQGTAADLTKEKASAVDELLPQGEKRTLTILFSFPEQADNAKQSGYLSFDLCADAVQSKNNPDRDFD
ncbi:MAG: hypothetical protein J6W28_08495 [Clostridia bacterium]|nr:hypothetical protein [Clostridia bacterium]MBO7171198.1 hypothetical protein [Clostridia bacterium]